MRENLSLFIYRVIYADIKIEIYNSYFEYDFYFVIFSHLVI